VSAEGEPAIGDVGGADSGAGVACVVGVSVAPDALAGGSAAPPAPDVDPVADGAVDVPDVELGTAAGVPDPLEEGVAVFVTPPEDGAGLSPPPPPHEASKTHKNTFTTMEAFAI
jgi:hypothetical protein